MQLLIGASLAAVIAAAAARLRILTRAGAVAAFFVGTCVFGCGGWRYAAVLFAFFIPAALLSRAGRARKNRLAMDKPGARDAWQVLANGGIAACCALAAVLGGGAHAGVAFAGAFAAASSDTWGTEIGTLSRRRPRLILTFAPINPGLSGGVTATGTLAELAGAAFVAAVAGAAGVGSFAAIAGGGIAGALADSLLGASVQAMHYCPRCDCYCEATPHRCGTPAALARGLPWINNDVVNVCATFVGAAVALLLPHAAVRP